MVLNLHRIYLITSVIPLRFNCCLLTSFTFGIRKYDVFRKMEFFYMTVG